MREVFGGLDRDAFAARVGVNKNTIAHYERGDRTPDAHVLARYKEVRGVDGNWLLTGDGPMFAEPRTAAEMNERLPAHLVTIPQFDIQAAAGTGLVPVRPDANQVSSYVTVDRDWLRRFLPTWAGTNAVVGILEGQGDSMEPTIHDGDMIIVANDPPWRAVAQGGIFVVLHHDQLRIKRLQHYPKTGDIDLISDNPRYAKDTVTRERVEFDLRILAQVFFAGGRLRS